MSDLGQFEVIVTPDVIEVLVDDQTSAKASQIARANSIAIPLGATLVQVDFPTDLADNLYEIIPGIKNLLDSNPQSLTAVQNLQEIGRARFILSAPTDTANYILTWILSPRNNP